VHVCIVVGGRATECRHGKRIGSAGRGASTCLNIVVGGRATECRHDKRIGSAGRGASACVHSCGWAGYGM
jgi:hypothetical protein